MGLIGQGKGHHAQLAQELTRIEAQLQSLTEVKERDLTPKGGAKVDAALAAVSDGLTSADPRRAAAARVMTDVLRYERLAPDDPVLADFVPGVLSKLGPGQQLPAEQLAGLLALIDERVSTPEYQHALLLIEPTLTLRDRFEMYRPRLEQNRQIEGKRKWFEVPTSVGAMGLPVGGALTLTTTLNALSLVPGPAGFALSSLSFLAGSEVGHHLVGAHRDHIAAYGANRLSEDVRHPFARALDRLSKAGSEREQQDAVALVGATIEAYQNRGELSPAEQAALGEFVRFQKEATASGFEGAHASLLSRVDRAALEQLAFEPLPRPEVFERALEVTLEASVHSGLVASSPALARLLASLERKYSASAEGAPAKLTPGELITLRKLAQESPSLWALYGVVRLADTGAVALRDVWPAGLDVELPGGKRLASGDLLAAIDRVGERDDADRAFNRARRAPMALRIIGALVGGAALPVLGLWGTIGSLVAFQYWGAQIAASRAKKAMTRKALAGVEVAPGMPSSSERALSIRELMRPTEWLGQRGTSLKRDVARQADFLRALSEAALPTLQTPGNFNEEKRAFQERLLACAGELQELSTQGGTDDALRRAALAASASAMHPTQLYRLLGEKMGESVTAEPGPFRMRAALQAKIDFLQIVRGLRQASASVPDIALLQAELLRAANHVESAWEPLRAAEANALGSDPVGALAHAVQAHPEKPLDMEALAALDATAEALVKGYGTRLKEVAWVDEKRARAIGQEVLDFVSTQFYPLVGLGEHDPGTLKVRSSTAIRSEEKGELEVAGLLKGGGTFAVTLTQDGRPRPETLRLDVGPDRAQELPLGLAREWLSAERGRDVEVRAVGAERVSEYPGVHLDDLGASSLYAVDLVADGIRYRLAVTAEGLPILDTLRPSGDKDRP
ncbi:MAG: hypothetical protein IT384_27275 [Deltaproteobacteria bacterium]|nr:hypothetical protein [Deltaproteobacteria bacterium]